jgi:hypothetical protein
MHFYDDIGLLKNIYYFASEFSPEDVPHRSKHVVEIVTI